MIKVLHLAAHLGGGVGKALSGLAAQAHASGAEFEHSFVCFEQPEKTQFIKQIRQCGGKVAICPDREQLAGLIDRADIVHLEWWSHPATLNALCNLRGCSARLVVWCHLSGLHNPIIPTPLLRSAHRALLTSACSLEARDIAATADEMGERMGIAYSSGGFAGLPWPNARPADEAMSVGYVGSLNFAKLHPDYVGYLAAVDLPDFKVRVIGDLTNQDILTRQCGQHAKPGMLDFRGYTTDIAAELLKINVLAYLLNPEHYGTAENALLEAMATGVVPVVLDNPCERCIVEDGKTGLVVRSPQEFAQAVAWLAQHPQERRKLGARAAESVRNRFTVERTEATINAHYRAAMAEEKKPLAFSDIFGNDPVDWFLSCQADRSYFMDDGNINVNAAQAIPFSLLEERKGTVFHYHRNFPENLQLTSWAKHLECLIA